MQDQQIDPTGPVPPYRQIAAIIKRRILSGQYPPNTRIPTESEIVEAYEVARSTARRAIAALRDEGLVYTVPARGTYVAERGNPSDVMVSAGPAASRTGRVTMSARHCSPAGRQWPLATAPLGVAGTALKPRRHRLRRVVG